MLVNMNEILKFAKDNNYAVPQFNINNLEWTRFILEACQEKNSAVILGVSETTIEYMGGYKNVRDIVITLIEYLDITVPVVLHLDHGKSYDSCKKFTYNPLKRIPKKEVLLANSDVNNIDF